MRKVRNKVTAHNGEAKYEYHGGVEHQKDMVILGFYSGVKYTISKLEVIIRKVLENSVITATNERSFNVAGSVLNFRNCSLDLY